MSPKKLKIQQQTDKIGCIPIRQVWRPDTGVKKLSRENLPNTEGPCGKSILLDRFPQFKDIDASIENFVKIQVSFILYFCLVMINSR